MRWIWIFLFAMPALAQDDAFVRKGRAWTYVCEGKEILRRVTGPEKIDGKELTVLEDEGLPDEFAKMYLETAEDGVRVVRLEKKISEPFLLVKKALKVGDTWSQKFEIGRFQKIQATWSAEVKAEEEIQAAGQKYKTFRIETTVTREGAEAIKIVSWFAPGTGDVKREVSVGTKTFAHALKGLKKNELEDVVRFSVDDSGKIVVEFVAADSELARCGLAKGDVLGSINNQPVSSEDQAYALIEKMIEAKSGRFTVERSGGTLQLKFWYGNVRMKR